MGLKMAIKWQKMAIFPYFIYKEKWPKMGLKMAIKWPKMLQMS